MMKLAPCPRCRAFLPPGVSSCPACPARLPGWVRWVAVAAGSSAVAMTLSACYGGPCAGGRCYEPDEPTACDDPSSDADGDGYCGELDCDEQNPGVHVGARDPADDGVDRDCDGLDGPR